MMYGSVRLSQAMIVRNEEKNIRRALSWAAGLVIEQIVVDTGSEDFTIQIAKEMGAKVFNFKWIDDFSAAKNFALSKCSGDWIAFLDADEYFSKEEAAKVPLALEKASEMGMDGIVCAYMQIGDNGEIGAGGTTLRLFRNSADLKYRRRIHEQVEFSDGRMLKAVDFSGELAILHTGYGELAAGKKIRSERNIRLIEKELSEHPNDHEMLGYLGDEYFARDRFFEAADCYRKAIKELPEDLTPFISRTSMTFVNYMNVLRHLEGHTEKHYEGGGGNGVGFGDGNGVGAWDNDGNGEEIKAVYGQGIRFLPEEPDLPYLLGLFYYDKGRYAEAAEYLTEAINKLSQYGAALQGALLSGNLFEAYSKLSNSMYEVGRNEEAVRYAVSVLKADKSNALALYVFIRAFLTKLPGQKEISTEEKIHFLSNIYDIYDARNIRNSLGSGLKDERLEASGIKDAELKDKAPGIKDIELNASRIKNTNDREFLIKVSERAGDWELARALSSYR